MSVFRVGSSLANLASSSTSRKCLLIFRPAAAALHTSAIRSAENQKQRNARVVRKDNIEKKAERARLYEANKPHVVLGTRPSDGDAQWHNCDLAKILVTEEELSSTPTTSFGSGLNVETPKYVSYGFDGLDGVETRDEQLDFFFKQLPETAASAATDPQIGEKLVARGGDVQALDERDREEIFAINAKEVEKARQIARVLDLRNANARGIAFENRRRIIAAFSPKGNANDSGYPEVQVALLTMKIRNVWSHLMQRKKDITSRRALRLLVHQRAKMLKYIKRMDRDRYDRVLERVGLEPEAVEGELVV